MKALTFQGVRDVRVLAVPDPVLCEPTDALVRVELAAICGSDLHPFRGHERGLDVGTVLGHEFQGEVIAVGSAVQRWRPGDRVVAPFSTSCGQCTACTRGLTSRCERGQLFGWVQGGRGLHGGQAELVRVPLADGSLVGIPNGTDPALLFAGDILSTGMFLAELGEVAPGSTVAVIGCGPVGLMAILAARARGAAQVFALDVLPERLALATEFGAAAVHADDRGAWPKGVDAALEAVGSPESTRLAYEVVRAGAVIAAAGVHTEAHFAITPGEVYDKNLTYRAGRAPARRFMEAALALGQSAGVARIVSHRLPLAEAREGYRIFDERLDRATKVLLEP